MNKSMFDKLIFRQTAKTIHESVINNAKLASGDEKLFDFGRT